MSFAISPKAVDAMLAVEMTHHIREKRHLCLPAGTARNKKQRCLTTPAFDFNDAGSRIGRRPSTFDGSSCDANHRGELDDRGAFEETHEWKTDAQGVFNRRNQAQSAQ